MAERLSCPAATMTDRTWPAKAMIARGQRAFESYAVSIRLNAAKEDGERLIEPVMIQLFVLATSALSRQQT